MLALAAAVFALDNGGAAGGGSGDALLLFEDELDGEEVGGEGEGGAERDVGLLIVGLGGQEGTALGLLALHVEGAHLGDVEAVEGLEHAADLHLGGGGDGLEGDLADGIEGRRRQEELDGQVCEVDHPSSKAASHLLPFRCPRAGAAVLLPPNLSKRMIKGSALFSTGLGLKSSHPHPTSISSKPNLE